LRPEKACAQKNAAENSTQISPHNIAIVGVGLGTASILASVPDLEMITELPPVNAYITHWQLSKPQANFVVSLNVSIFAGVWVAIFTAIVIKLGELLR
jgi:hypothetical protein